MPAFTPFTSNYTDLSDENGYQFEFRCDVCGSGYRSEFIRSNVGTAGNLLQGASSLFGGFFNSASNAADTAMFQDMNSVYRTAFPVDPPARGLPRLAPVEEVDPRPIVRLDHEGGGLHVGVGRGHGHVVCRQGRQNARRDRGLHAARIRADVCSRPASIAPELEGRRWRGSRRSRRTTGAAK